MVQIRGIEQDCCQQRDILHPQLLPSVKVLKDTMDRGMSNGNVSVKILILGNELSGENLNC